MTEGSHPIAQAILDGQAYKQESGEKQFLNYEYLFPYATSTNANGDVTAKLLEYIAEYDQKFAFYNFTVASGESPEAVMARFDELILAASQHAAIYDEYKFHELLMEDSLDLML